MCSNFQTSLPPHGVPTMISEIIVPSEALDGKSVRVVGRVDHFDARNNMAWLSEPSKSSASTPESSKLRVDASLTDSEDFRTGSQVMLIGELEKIEETMVVDDEMDINKKETESLGYIVLRARVSRCVDRLDYALYQQSIEVLRKLADS